MVNPGPLHRGRVERGIGAIQNAVGTDLADRPFHQAGHDRPGTRRVDVDVALRRCLDRSDLQARIAGGSSAVAQVGQQQLDLGESLGEGQKIEPRRVDPGLFELAQTRQQAAQPDALAACSRFMQTAPADSSCSQTGVL